MPVCVVYCEKQTVIFPFRTESINETARSVKGKVHCVAATLDGKKERYEKQTDYCGSVLFFSPPKGKRKSLKSKGE